MPLANHSRITVETKVHELLLPLRMCDEICSTWKILAAQSKVGAPNFVNFDLAHFDLEVQINVDNAKNVVDWDRLQLL